jgi:nitrogen regulatory protein PII
MNKLMVMAIVIGVIATIFLAPLLTDQFVNAKTLKKIQFTQTLTSMQDPGQGHESHQLAIVLSPNKGAIYDGSITYTASEPVQIVILHEINKDDAKGQPTWTVDGNTVFGLTLVDPGTSAGSYEFTGAALALHTKNTNKFTATVSVDGWIRGQTPELIEKKEETTFESSLKISRSSVPAEIPLHKAFFDEKSVYYIITDTNDKAHAKAISEKQKWKVEIAPPLSKTPKESLGDVYIFLNGMKGNGTYGFQDEVFSNTPAQTEQYSAIRSVTHVTWKDEKASEVLDSIQKILDTKKAGKIELEKTDAIINMPQIVWPDGQMPVRTDKALTDDTPYAGEQILDINLEKMTVTFVAHRGWGPDGRTIYYIVTDATPSGPANALGVTNAPTLAKTLTSPAAVDLYQFTNGIKGSGPLGFQAGIASAALGDETYSPLWRISVVTWNEPVKALVLETIADINAKKSSGDVTIELARPMDSDHIVNCPFIDPFQ